MRSFKETVCTHSTVKAVQLIYGSERHISAAWLRSVNIGKSCLSYAIFSFWILSPNNLFICTVTQSHDIVFKFPHAHWMQKFIRQTVPVYGFFHFTVFEGIRLVTPSEAWHDNSDILVTEKFLKRFTLPVDNPEGRGEGEAEFASKYIHQTGGLIT